MLLSLLLLLLLILFFNFSFFSLVAKKWEMEVDERLQSETVAILNHNNLWMFLFEAPMSDAFKTCDPITSKKGPIHSWVSNC